MKWPYLILLLITFGNSNCQTQPKKKVETTNPLLCNPESGFCEIPETRSESTETISTSASKKQIKVIYYTDPICSSCWGIEPQLRKLKLEYGSLIEIDYRMGGLLPDWNYNSGGISKPSDVAHHWDEVSAYYDMPIDGDIWLEDPLPSSYPPSIAFKAAQMQDEQKAVLFLREIREMVFLQKKNICKWEHIELAAKHAGLDPAKLHKDYEGKARELFNEDLKVAKELGVRGFPTMFFSDTVGKTEVVYGSKPYASYEDAIKKLSLSPLKYNYDKNWKSVFLNYSTLTAKEFAELTETPRPEAEKKLDELTKSGVLEKLTTKNGSLWKIKKK
ncbi:dithiol-disulfide isomerase [Sphingobacteriaceae bacterium]|nr:dithiol-disulfide isomerase [Sphingobacteriaceae bacterium]